MAKKKKQGEVSGHKTTMYIVASLDFSTRDQEEWGEFVFIFISLIRLTVIEYITSLIRLTVIE